MKLYMSDPISRLPLVGSVYQKRLKRLGIRTIEDILLHLPHRYEDYRHEKSVSYLKEGESITVRGKVETFRNQYTKSNKKIQLLVVKNKKSRFKIVWFNQPFLSRTFKKGEEFYFSGKTGWFGREIVLMSPDYEKIEKGKSPIHTLRLVPIYPEIRGISSKWLRRRIFDLYLNEIEFTDYLDKDDLSRMKLITRESAFKKIHYPKDFDDVYEGRRRLAFDEILTLVFENRQREGEWIRKKPNFSLNIKDDEMKKFFDSIPFKLTASQIRSINEILKDMRSELPMNRLLQGDVGSGKTIVAAASCFASFSCGYQSVVMAPTLALAQQHYETLGNLFKPFGAKVSIFTSFSGKKKDIDADIIVGTHALLYKSISQLKVALVVIDEQHRFGVKQRAEISEITKQEDCVPHVLTMTATPIPRSIALTFYGDLDVSFMKDIPMGRKKIKTWIVPEEKRAAAYEWISNEIKRNKVQVFVICPLIEESKITSMSEVKSAKKEYEKIIKIFPDLRIGLLHGRLKSGEREGVIDKLRKGEIDILVSTPVVEVGIDIPNATIIVIETADRFGLAQLHQLRGRVGRSTKQSYCLLFSESKGEKARKRLEILRENHSGFELSEMDLRMRGPGEIFGIRQHGIPELKIASWSDIDIIKQAKKFVQEIYSNKNKYKRVFEYFDSKKIAFN